MKEPKNIIEKKEWMNGQKNFQWLIVHSSEGVNILDTNRRSDSHHNDTQYNDNSALNSIGHAA
jgi:hypothetical protein